jgi:hypothetical protein
LAEVVTQPVGANLVPASIGDIRDFPEISAGFYLQMRLTRLG